MKIKKKLKPGQPGTRKYVEKFGDDLICIRHCFDQSSGERVVTAEIVVNKKQGKNKKKHIPGNKLVRLKIYYSEVKTRELIKKAGGKWNAQNKVWIVPFHEASALGLEKRISHDSKNIKI